MSIGVLDHAGLIRLFRQLEGRRLLGAIDCTDCVELVFEEARNSGNLVTVFTAAGRRTGLVAFGFVCDPDEYVRGWSEAA